jgi:lipopolysaccharide/colanic/teichoic acid biosynthesis glycosyltransferase/glycosyltransferase involved in cell wall biosynthesis
MRVLHLGKFYRPFSGGIETVLETLCRGAHAHQTRALVTTRSHRTVHETLHRVAVTRVGSLMTIGSVTVAPTLPLWLARAEADVIVLHEPNPMALVAYYLARPDAPLIVWYHSEVIRPRWRYRLFYEPLLEFALKRAVRIVVAAPPMLEVPALVPHRTKCIVVPYGLEVERYHASPAVIARAKSLRDGAPAPILLFAGRMVRYKGLDVLIRALPGLEVETILVGDGPLRPSLEAMAKELGVDRRVRFVGEVSDEELLAWYYASEMFVLPSISRQEAFGIVQLEAMLCGRPVISTDVPTGVPWVNEHERTGLVVRHGDVAALRGAIARLACEVAFRQKLGEGARARVLAQFTAGQMCGGMEALYEQAGAAGSAARVAPARSGSVSLKRGFDILVSGLGLVASAPLWALLALAVKLEDGGSVYYAQERSGLHGRRFRALKFRSMIPDAEAKVGAVQASENDPRVTRIGRLMRATAMDELPQLWNIFRGDMSFVGPRALRPGEIEPTGSGRMEMLEDVPGFAERASLRPGLTGIAQVYAPRDVPRRAKFRYDLVYVRRHSFWSDLRLIGLSFWITFRGTWEERGKKF